MGIYTCWIILYVTAMVAAPLNFCYFVAGIVGLTTAFVSLLFTITAACCITAAHTKGRREWNRAGSPLFLEPRHLVFCGLQLPVC